MKPARLPAELETRTAKSGGRHLWIRGPLLSPGLSLMHALLQGLLADGDRLNIVVVQIVA